MPSHSEQSRITLQEPFTPISTPTESNLQEWRPWSFGPLFAEFLRDADEVEISWECTSHNLHLEPTAFNHLRPISEVPAAGRIWTKTSLSQVPTCVPGVQPVRATSIFHRPLHQPVTDLPAAVLPLQATWQSRAVFSSVNQIIPLPCSNLSKDCLSKQTKFQIPIRIFKVPTSFP